MTRPRPALGEALAACRAEDILVVTQLARLARSVPDAHQLISQLSARQVTLAVGDDRYLPRQPAAQVLLQVLVLTRDLQTAVNSADTRQGLTAARARGGLRGRPPKLSPLQERHLVDLYVKDEHTVGEVGDLLNVSRSTVYRAVRRAAAQATDL